MLDRPLPELIVLGDSPVAQALTALAGPLGFRVRTAMDEPSLGGGWVVAAGMSSHVDHPAVRRALTAGACYVAMVASARRTAGLLAELRAEGFSQETLARLSSPAGLQIGAATAPEIALSILAEVVQKRRLRPAPGVGGPPRSL